MNINVFYGILIPFIGTSVGAACGVNCNKKAEKKRDSTYCIKN